MSEEIAWAKYDDLRDRVAALADELTADGWNVDGGDAADRLRALIAGALTSTPDRISEQDIADDTARTTSSRGPTTDTDAPPPV